MVSPVTQTTAPMPIASTIVRWKEEVINCATATGTIINAETSSRPTTRIATVTVSAATTAMRMVIARTGKPVERANSSSWHTANSAVRSEEHTSELQSRGHLV